MFREFPVWILCLFLLAPLACKQQQSDVAAESEAEPPTAAAPAAEPAPAQAPPARPPRADVPTGEFSVSVDDEGLVTVEAKDAPRVSVLKEIGAKAGFEVMPTRRLQPHGVTLSLSRVSALEAIEALADDISYALLFDPAPEGEEGSRLTAVRIGLPSADQRRASRERFAKAREAMRQGGRPGQGQGQGPGGMRIIRRPPMEREDVLAGVESNDVELREKAVSYLDAEGEDLDLLAKIVAEDDDPTVRATAAERLSHSESITSVRALVAALDDPEKEVVLEAIDGLSFVGDPGAIPDLKKKLSDPDPEVVEAAQDAIEFLE